MWTVPSGSESTWNVPLTEEVESEQPGTRRSPKTAGPKRLNAKANNGDLIGLEGRDYGVDREVVLGSGYGWGSLAWGR